MRHGYGAIAARAGIPTGRSMPARRTLVAVPGVRYWRIRRTLLQRQLAELAQIDIHSLQRLEAGGLAGLDTVARLARALDVDAEQLMATPPEA
jgi:ABC-type transporter Mla MlaB component